MNTRPLKKEEIKYTYRNCQDVSMRTGLIGYLRADLGRGEEFYSTWWPFRENLNTPDFKKEFDNVINSLRGIGECLFDLGTMEAFCDTDNVLRYPDNDHYYGLRVDTDQHAYLMRLYPYKGDYNLYCYCYIKEWLDSHIERAKHGISIRNAKDNYKEICRLNDGDEIILQGEPMYAVQDKPTRYTCRYIDDTHFIYGNSVVHEDQFAERVAENGYTVVPMRRSLPERCYVFIQTSPNIGIVVKGESGYYRTEITAPTRDERRAMVDELNEKLGVTKAQAEAMKSGSMFGWHVPLADPRSYDEDGNLLKRRKDGN